MNKLTNADFDNAIITPFLETEYDLTHDRNSIPNLISVGDIDYHLIKSDKNNPLLQKAFELAFDVYVVEREYVRPSQLSGDQLDSKQYFDIFDISPTTKHIIATKGDDVVGRARYTDGICPIGMHFDLSTFLEFGAVREISRIITHPNERSSLTLLLGLTNYCYNTSKHLGQFFCSSFDDGAKLYLGMGAEEIGTFQNPEYPVSPTSHVFRWDVGRLESGQVVNPQIKKGFVHKMIKPLENEYRY